MIYTLTINPSLDYIIQVDDFEIGKVNRTSYEEILPGGKGINVSIVLNNLGIDSVALGFLSGFTGQHIKEAMKKAGCQTDFINLNSGISRINVKLKSGMETEINGQGPVISDKDLETLFHKIEQLSDGDILVLAGSIPNSLPGDLYERIMARIQEREIKVVVDATKDLLVNVLKYHPFLIKPNNYELGEIFGVDIQSKDEVIFYARKLKDAGAANVLISMAGEGAVFISDKGEVYESNAPKGKVVNSVGAGDSMVAGFLSGYLEKGDYLTAFKTGIAAGSASAFSKELAKKGEVIELLKTI